MALAAAPKVARLIPLLGSPVDGEALGAARAIGRALKASGADWHDLAREIGHSAPVEIQHHARRPRRERAPTTAGERQAVEALRRALSLDLLNEWEVEFSQSILGAAQRRDWHPTRRQAGVIDRLVRKARDMEAFTL